MSKVIIIGAGSFSIVLMLTVILVLRLGYIRQMAVNKLHECPISKAQRAIFLEKDEEMNMGEGAHYVTRVGA